VEHPGRRDHRNVIKQHRTSGSPEEKARLRRELEQQLGDEYDRRIEMREAQLKDTEEKLAEIRQTLQQGREEKDAFIAEKLSLWLDD
jgi:hypothetical protein